jgi:hypothetical protein
MGLPAAYFLILPSYFFLGSLGYFENFDLLGDAAK